MTDPDPEPNAAYVDTSVLVAALATDDASHVRARKWLLANQEHVVTSVIAEVELHRSLSRRSAPSQLRSVAARLLQGCELIDLSPEIRAQAIDVAPMSTRGLDALHVATALVAQVSSFASFDVRQQVAAAEMGLTIAAL